MLIVLLIVLFGGCRVLPLPGNFSNSCTEFFARLGVPQTHIASLKNVGTVVQAMSMISPLRNLSGTVRNHTVCVTHPAQCGMTITPSLTVNSVELELTFLKFLVF
eukprot:1920656-Amphidinium_carterae.1